MSICRSLVGVTVISLSICSLASAQHAVTFDGPVTDIDGRLGPQYSGPGSEDVQLRRRPWTPTDANLLLENISIHDVTNQKGIDIGSTTLADGSIQTYQNITVRNYDNYNDVRNVPGLHIDGLRIAGGGNKNTYPTNVTLQDVSVHDGSSLPVNIQDGWFDTIILDDVQVYNNLLNQVQIATIHSGHINHIIVENSPGLSVAIMGQPGSIGDVQVINSPGANVNVNENYPVLSDFTGANPNDALFSTDSASAASIGDVGVVPEPASMTLLGMGMLLAVVRRRRKLA